MKNANPTSIRFPADVKAWLKSRANANRRSLNGEILTILEKAMQADPALPKPATDIAA